MPVNPAGFGGGKIASLRHMAGSLRSFQSHIAIAPLAGPPRLAWSAQVDTDLLPLIGHPHRQRLAPYVPADRLFVALDGRDLTIGGGQWRIEVFSVSECDGDRWVQLALSGEKHGMLTMKVSTSDGAGRVLLGISSWIGDAPAPPTFADAVLDKLPVA